MTRRLDDNLSSSDFEQTRKPLLLRKHVRTLAEHTAYVAIGVILVCLTLRFILQTYFPGHIRTMLTPIIGKQGALVEQIVTGLKADEGADLPEVQEENLPAAVKTKPVAKHVTAKPRKKSRRTRRHRHHHPKASMSKSEPAPAPSPATN